MKIHFLALILLLVSCKPNSPEVTPLEYGDGEIKKELVFGIHPHHNPSRLHKVFAPLIKVINEELSKSSTNLSIRIEASRDYLDFEKKMAKGVFHFSLLNPYQTLLAQDLGYKVFAKMGDDNKTKSLLVARKDSNINSIEDLKGKTICFSAPTALTTGIMPQNFLLEKGIDLKQDISITYLGTHESTLMGVYNRTCDVGAACPSSWELHQKENQKIFKELTILWETKSLIGNGIVHKKGLAPSIVSIFKKTLLNLHKNYDGNIALNKLSISHFEAADAKSYSKINKYISDFSRKVRPPRSSR